MCSLYRIIDCGSFGFQLIILLFLCLFMFLCTIILLFFFYCFYWGRLMLDLYLFSMYGIDFSLTFVVDYLSVGFFGCVSFISGVVFYYRVFYMAGGKE